MERGLAGEEEMSCTCKTFSCAHLRMWPCSGQAISGGPPRMGMGEDAGKEDMGRGLRQRGQSLCVSTCRHVQCDRGRTEPRGNDL